MVYDSVVIASCIFSFIYLTFNSTIHVRWIDNESNWNDMTKFLSTLNYPVIVSNTPLSYHSVTKWTFQSLSRQLKTISCKYSNNSVFHYHAAEQPLDNVPEFAVPKNYENVIMMATEMFDKIQTNNNGQYFYSSGPIDNLSFKSVELLSNITFPSHKGSGQVNYWFGGTNVTAYTHYDTSHNLHLLIKGKKRFLLYPPSYHYILKLYPCLHSLYRQAQVNNIKPYLIIDLMPGEVLYLPPFWFHSVITLSPSISVNIWSDSQDYLLMEDIFNTPIPFQEEWGLKKLMKAVTLFITTLLDGVKIPRTFIETVVFKRYEVLIANISLTDSTIYCQNVQKYCHPLSTESNITNRTLKIASLFLKMSTNDVMEINIANYIEYVTYTILQQHNIKELPFYFKECF